MIALLVIGNGRTDFLSQAVRSARDWLPPVDRLLMVDDSGDLAVRKHLDQTYRDFTITHHHENQGMAAAVQAGFDMVLDTGAEYVFWLEEDMVLCNRPPLWEAKKVLYESPQLAQMCFRRESTPGNQYEWSSGCQLNAITQQASFVYEWPTWTEHDFIFSMNPCLIPRNVLELGWDADNEAGMTAKLKEKGYRFGSWGHASDGQVWATHVGYAQRAAVWQL